ncbi:MAG: DNA gyrase subunit A [bacterium]
MPELHRQRVIPVNIEEEMKSSYIDYSMSVIVSRALPDVRDGLKPVHRRILYGMDQLGLRYNRSYRKSARLVGDVLGKYHPHGDSAVYDAAVRMAQDFSLRYPLVDGQGNFGSVDGDSAAAMRYTEVRLTRIAEEMLRDLDKDTVDWTLNFDDTMEEPGVLPTKLPNLLVNGASGIAVGMSTNIPPHNLTEVVDGLVHLIDDPDADLDDLMEHITGPDFPTGGIIYGRQGIREAYETGRGRVVTRARAFIEDHKDREWIVITEIPYQVNKSNLLEKIADLVRDKKVEGISDLRDESDRDGMRIVIELKRDAPAEVILNHLYKYTQLQNTFGVINLSLVDGEPRELNLKQTLQAFVDFRHEVVERRTRYELAEAEARAHILEGLRIATDNIDEIVALIKKAADTDTAKAQLMERFELSDVQAQAILDMRLARLTGLERQKIEEEYRDLIEKIAHYKEVLANKNLRMAIIKDELTEIRDTFGDARRTEILDDQGDFDIEDLIAEEDMVITISHQGYMKRIPITTYRRQRRGGRGVKGMGTKEDDFVEHLFVASTHSYLLFFTDQGKVYWLKVYDIPQGGRQALGRPLINLIQVEKGETVRAVVPVRSFEEGLHLIFATREGLVKKTSLMDYSHPRRGGIIAVDIREGDELIEVGLTDGTCDVILGTRKGMAIRFHEEDVRPMSRDTRGVKGITLDREDDGVVGMVVVRREGTLLTVAENGFGKRTRISDYPVQHRGGKGVITMKASERNGDVLTLKEVVDSDELMLISRKGTIIRQPAEEISTIGRNTQGVRLMNVPGRDRVVDVARVMEKEEEEEEEAALEAAIEEAEEQRKSGEEEEGPEGSSDGDEDGDE